MDFRLEYVGPHGLHTPEGHKTKGEAFVANEHWVHGNAHLITGPHPLIVMRDADKLRKVQLGERAPAILDHERKLREPGDAFLAPDRWLVTKCGLIRSGRLVEVEPTEVEGGAPLEMGEQLGEPEYVEDATPLEPAEETGTVDDLADRLEAIGWPNLQKLVSDLRGETDDKPSKSGKEPYIEFALKYAPLTLELLPEHEG